MGKIISRFRKKPTTLEKLEEIERDIASLQRLRRRDGELERQYVGTLVLYSVFFYVIYFIMALVFYFHYVPEKWTGRAIQILPLLLFPVIIWLVRRLIRYHFTRRISRCDMQLSDLRVEKKKILEEVKEKESYKVAKEILEKYDPASVAPPPTPVVVTPQSSVAPALRQRLPASGGRGRGRGRGSTTPMIPSQQTPLPPASPWTTPQMPGQRPMSRPPSTIRPILQRERGTMDKLVDYFVQDGPGNRYALICRHCYSHNGMALKEEFEYLAFRCAYCRTFNPSRKTRPNAPKLPESGPSSSAEQASSREEDESSSEDEERPEPKNVLPQLESGPAVEEVPPSQADPQGAVAGDAVTNGNREDEEATGMPLGDGSDLEATGAVEETPLDVANEFETDPERMSEGPPSNVEVKPDVS